MQQNILIIEDDKNTKEGLKKFLEEEKYKVIAFSSGKEAIDYLKENKIGIILSDMKMPGISGIEVLKKTQKISPSTFVIILTAYGTVGNAVEAMKLGAYDYLTKPVNLDKLSIVIQRALSYRKLKEDYELLKKGINERYSFENIIGQSKKMKQVFDKISQVAPTKATVIIQGESGTGKELIAKAIHQKSDRKDKNFIAVQCSALSKGVMESELFGHEKGAFTGAIGSNQGRFELSNGGTLFLDEISEISPSVQVKLLRVLEERQFERVGGTKTIKVDTRIIAATNQDLEKLIKENKFREDLYWRLNVVKIEVPPLRERREDIPILIHSFIKESSKANKKRIKGISSKALILLQNHNWRGNVRELKNTIESIVVLSNKEIIGVKEVSSYVKEPRIEETINIKGPMRLDEIEKIAINHTLKKAGGNQSEAAKILGISRKTLRRKLSN
ncbi:MAG: sigma-54 dependent transcriptional regulator [Candidatus Omnitrophica bacterium]|nr:sigma-54 dependent transcriptional regulator [Candidatus Omnitrophota bacterium]MBU1047128.1 sigma-54 dependent transcriptional regulator [Candidatus Omnitrophota bacterium]MBU1630576.1 sigma-54 dependent transcriptional regulator [Candidatus Omnitrophota bacterium]MBU1766557.1 sigma-54 dependent transcriptional regulator [Candidatus Omnitrophota bacterium]MBU1889594.1 sigma-54 dependent transcriptional regulator [Candidatus Omnitrophota bacterium]